MLLEVRFAFFLFLGGLLLFDLVSGLLVLFEVEFDDQHGHSVDLPELTLVVLGDGEHLNEVDPVIDGKANELSQVGVQNEFESHNDTLQF